MSNMICQIADSSGGLPRDFMEQHDIHEVPFYFKFEGTDYYRENVDYSLPEFYRHMEEFPNDVPKTSAPNLNDWLTVLEEQYIKGITQYIITTISAKLSSSPQTALLAKNAFLEKHPDVQVELVDSGTCACGQAALEIAVAKMIESGRDFQAILSMIRRIAGNVNTLFVVNNLKYMQAGGRIGGATAFIGKLAQIKPVCEFVNGAVHPVKAAIGRKNSLKSMVDIAVSKIAKMSRPIISVQNAGFPQDAEHAIAYFRKASGFSGTIYQSDLGITVGAHSGPGAAGIGFIEDPLALT